MFADTNAPMIPENREGLQLSIFDQPPRVTPTRVNDNGTIALPELPESRSP